MSAEDTVNLGQAIFTQIENDEYLIALYEKLLMNHGLKLLGEPVDDMGEAQIKDVLRFADLLSKSTHETRREYHQVWAQEIAILCHELYQEHAFCTPYLTSIFQSVGNYQALSALDNQELPDIFEQAFNAFQAEYLKVPGEDDLHFFAPQKRAFDAFDKSGFSFSAPTSLGKSFLMRTFIKDRIRNGHKENFAILVPTKALINELRSRFINDLERELERRNYRVVSSAGDIVLEGEHNFIFVLTPERLLYLLINKPGIRLDYLFIDEAHKLSGKNKRAPFYYQVTTMLLQRRQRPTFIFASPSIPNPQAFLNLLNDEVENTDYLVTRFSPVTQFKYLVPMNEQRVLSFNPHSQETNHLVSLPNHVHALRDFLLLLRQQSAGRKPCQTLVYHGGKDKAIENAQEYAKPLPKLTDNELASLADDIRREVHSSYFLADLVEKGIAYHVGYLPASVRLRVEELFREGKIHTIFCTSTLLEGVNLPADNLIVVSNRNGTNNLTGIDFNNLIGRVGRIEFNLYGNVFFVTGNGYSTQNTVQKLLTTEVPPQKLAIDDYAEGLPHKVKQKIVAALKEGKMPPPETLATDELGQMARTFSIVLLRDLTANRTSLVTKAFENVLDEDCKKLIVQKFTTDFPVRQDDDINVSVDQQQSLETQVKVGLAFPKIDPQIGRAPYDHILRFLEQLWKTFKWETYEPKTIGNKNKLSWYAVILSQWIEGNGLKTILERAVDYRHTHPMNFMVNHKPTKYDHSPLHQNIVCNDTLEAIENVILFSFANYFLRVSNAIKKHEGKETIENDWYEYVEYGTTNPDTIILQRMGYTRESATWIRRNVPNCAYRDQQTGAYHLNPVLLECQNINVRRESQEIQFNIPSSFDSDFSF